MTQEQMIEMKTDVALTKQVVERLEKRLIGQDGNGGFVATTEAKLKEHDAALNFSKGVLAFLSAVLGLFGLSGLAHILKASGH